MTLTEFLLARIAEDEAWVSEHFAGVTMVVANPGDHFVPIPGSMDRVLAECEAKRRIVEGLQPFGWLDDINAPEILGALAAVYADHMDYLPEWAPHD